MEFPSYKDLFNRFSAKFREQKPTVDPSIKGSWSGAFGRGVSAVGYACVILAKEVLKQFNPLTATGSFLDLWASYDNLTRLGASASIGVVRAYGIDTTVVPANTQFSGDDNAILYQSAVASTIQPQDPDTPPAAVSGITRSGSDATAVTFFPHNYQNGDWVRISGADQAEYNGIFQITVNAVTPYEFSYTVSGSPTSPATGTLITSVPVVVNQNIVIDSTSFDAVITTPGPHQLVVDQWVRINNTDVVDYNGNWQITDIIDDFSYQVNFGLYTSDPTEFGTTQSIHAKVNVTSTTTGSNTVLAPKSSLTAQVSDPDIYEFSYTVEGLQGGAEAETDEELRARLLLSRSAQEGVFTNDQVELSARLINGNTRVYIKNPDQELLGEPGYILPGQVQIYILRDDDPLGVIPTGSILAVTKESIINNGRLPAGMWENDIFVLPPVLRPINITIDNVVPNTSTMKTALKNQFEAYFTDSALFGEDIDNDVLRAVVVNTQDLEAADPEKSYIQSFDWVDATITGDVYKVEASGASVSRFFYLNALAPSFGQTVVMSNFTEPTYNGTFTVTGVGADWFEIGIAFVSNDSGNHTLQGTSIAFNEIPVLGVLTVNDTVV